MAARRRRVADHLRAVLLLVVVPPLVVAAILLMPVWLPLVAWSQAREDRRRRRCAERTPCWRCGAPLGEPALAHADRLFAAYLASFAAQGLRLRTVRRLHACCVRCDAPHRYLAEADRFEPLDPREFAAIAGAAAGSLPDPADGAQPPRPPGIATDG